jgi:hypothetical protein
MNKQGSQPSDTRFYQHKKQVLNIVQQEGSDILHVQMAADVLKFARDNSIQKNKITMDTIDSIYECRIKEQGVYTRSALESLERKHINQLIRAHPLLNSDKIECPILPKNPVMNETAVCIQSVKASVEVVEYEVQVEEDEVIVAETIPV